MGDVKLGQLPAWLSRRSADPRMMMAAVGRANARWQLNYHHAVRPGLAPLFQIWAFCIATGFIVTYHKQCKLWFYFLNAKIVYYVDIIWIKICILIIFGSFLSFQTTNPVSSTTGRHFSRILTVLNLIRF